MPSPRLTIGFACYDDIEGAFFTLSSLRLHHLGGRTGWELLVVDDHPNKTPDLESCASLAGARYVHSSKNRGPAHAKNTVFDAARGEHVLLLDSHVLLAPGSIDYLLDAIERGAIGRDMWCGPLLNESASVIATHLDPIWRGDFFGIWATDPDIAGGAIKEIPMHGAAHFVMRRDRWPGFSPSFQGFAGEEGYIHEKVRRAGGRVLCHPALGWVHRFVRGKPITYSVTLSDKIYNYLIAFYEVGWSPQGVLDFFATTPHAAHSAAALQRAQRVYPDLLRRSGRTFARA